MTPQQQQALARVGSDCDQTLAEAREFVINCWSRGQGRQVMEVIDLSNEMAANPDPMVRLLGRFAGLGMAMAIEKGLPEVWGGPQHGE